MFVVVFEPLDGSSNVDAGIPAGTIVGIYEHDGKCVIDIDNFEQQAESVCMANTFEAGTKLVACSSILSVTIQHFLRFNPW